METMTLGNETPRYFECCLCCRYLPSDPDQIFETTCHHIFHVQCIRNFIRKDDSDDAACPFCQNRFEKEDYFCIYHFCEWCDKPKDKTNLQRFCQQCAFNFDTLQENVKLLTVNKPLEENVDEIPRPLQYFLFSDWRKSRNAKKEQERILLYMNFLLQYALSISNCVKYFHSDVSPQKYPRTNSNFIQLLNDCLKCRKEKYDMKFESHKQKVCKDTSRLNSTLEDLSLFKEFKWDYNDSEMAHATYQRIVMEYANVVANLYQFCGYGEKINDSMQHELDVFRNYIVEYENQVLQKALFNFLQKLPYSVSSAFSSIYDIFICQQTNNNNEMTRRVDLKTIEDQMFKIKKCYFVIYYYNNMEIDYTMT